MGPEAGPSVQNKRGVLSFFVSPFIPRVFEIRRKVAKSSILSQNVKLATTYQKIQIHVPGFGYQDSFRDFHVKETSDVILL